MKIYKGYSGTLELDHEDRVFHGRVSGISDVITYEGRTPDELTQAFHDSVDDYLAFCAERGEEPEKPYSGKFVVRISPQLHCMAAEAAFTADQSLNAWVKSAIEVKLMPPSSEQFVQKALLTPPATCEPRFVFVEEKKTRYKEHTGNPKKKTKLLPQKRVRGKS